MSLEENFSACFVRREENSFLYHIPADFPAFNGHFEGNPLLPAVCQMGLCADALSRQEGKPVEVAEVVRSKFMRPIGPGSRVRISFVYWTIFCFMAAACASFRSTLAFTAPSAADVTIWTFTGCSWPKR